MEESITEFGNYHMKGNFMFYFKHTLLKQDHSGQGIYIVFSCFGLIFSSNASKIVTPLLLAPFENWKGVQGVAEWENRGRSPMVVGAREIEKKFVKRKSFL